MSSSLPPEKDFQTQSQESAPGWLVEFTDFLLHNKKWWLTPILIALLILSLFVVLTGSTAAPFIYSFF